MLTLVSGGQTGVDRGAFETALRLGLDFGGWAPKGFRAEDGRIPEVYARRMRESADEGYALRTRLNVQDSDATLILSWSSSPEKAGGGTWFTEKTCRQQGKQCVHLRLPRAGEEHPPEVQDGVLKWLRLWKVGVLNVAGPRESKCPGIQAATIACLRWLLEPLAVQQVDQLASEISMIDRALAAQPHPAVANVGLVVDPPEGLDDLQRAQLDASIREAESDIREAGPLDEFLQSIACCPRPPSKADIEGLTDEFYKLEGNGAGGSLHVVLDDNNWERESVEFCRKWASDRGDIAGVRFAELLLALTDEHLHEYLGAGYCGRCGADSGDEHVRNDLVQQTFPPGQCPECGSEPAQPPAPGDPTA